MLSIDKIRKSVSLMMAISIMGLAVIAPTQVAYAVPGDIIINITTPVASPSCCAIGIAVDCQDPVNVFYTHSFSPLLHKMDKTGTAIGAPVAMTNVAGDSISFGAISWDETRGKLWGGTDGTANGFVQVYLIDPVTGVSVFIFTLTLQSFDFCDGIAFDGSDNSIWVSDDVTNWVQHWNVSAVNASGVGAPAQLATIFPTDAAGNSITQISGVAVGKGNILYLGRDGLGKITRVLKNGTFDSEFTTVGGRNEGLACDVVSFAPLEVLWSKDAFNNTVDVIEVESNTCVCPGGGAPPVVDVTPPVITCPSNISVACSNSSGATVSFTATATDNTDPNPVVSCSPASGSTFPIGVTTVTCTATDSANNSASCTFTVTVTEGFATIVGTLSAGCSVLGITVDIFDASGTLVGFGVTDASGNYSVPNLPSGQTYTVSFVAPLGYTAAVSQKQVAVLCNETVTCDFALGCPTNAGEQRTIGFWKHQVGVATGGKGKAKIDGATLCDYLDLIENHFNGNAVNQVIVYQPPGSGLCADKLLELKSLLNLKGSVTMTARAKQQLMALLLNVASGKLSQTAAISVDGATVSQAITYCDNLIDDGAGDHEKAKTIADLINNNVTVPAGVIPLSTLNIAYKVLPLEFSLSQNYPNPFNPATGIKFTISKSVNVNLVVFNLMGQKIETLIDRPLGAGEYKVEWDGSRFASGVYFYRLQAGSFIANKKMVLMK